MTFAGRLEKLLCEVERETFQHLQLRFPLFLASPEYVFLVAQEKAQESSKVRSFRGFNAFLDFVKHNNEAPFIDGVCVEEGGEGHVFDFGAHDECVKALVQGKVFVHHGEDFCLHLNQFGSFCEGDDDSCDGLQPDRDRTSPSSAPLRETLSPSRQAAVSTSSDEETLCDLYPSLSPRVPLSGPHSAGRGRLEAPSSSSSAAARQMLHHMEGEGEGEGGGEPWGMELKEPDRTPESSSPYLSPTERAGAGAEGGKAAFQVPFMVDCLSVRCCVQLSMILCSNM